MLHFLADENLNDAILRGLLRKKPLLDIVRVQDVGLSGSSDPQILEWAAAEGRILLPHDLRTIPRFAYEPPPGWIGRPGNLCHSEDDGGRAGDRGSSDSE